MTVPVLLRGVLQVNIHDLWHAGSGRGHGTALDAVVVLTPDGLPCLPGRHLRGLLREAMQCLESWGHAPEGATLRLFGGEAEADQSDVRQRRSRPGRLGLSSARLSEAEEAWLVSIEGRQTRPHLFTEVFATAIDKSGVAKDHSLRSMQMTVPMDLQAELELLADDTEQARGDWTLLQQATALIRHVGASRSRGSGRATLVLGDVQPDGPGHRA